jgi:hypothetical protein
VAVGRIIGGTIEVAIGIGIIGDGRTVGGAGYVVGGTISKLVGDGAEETRVTPFPDCSSTASGCTAVAAGLVATGRGIAVG